MSILIKGMKMPTACIYCPFMVSHDGDDCILQSNEANASFLNWEQMKAGCPLVELPPHGDLIDREKIPFVEAEYACDDYAFRYDINEMTPVIPADPEGGSD